jgi:hypothetical protein
MTIRAFQVRYLHRKNARTVVVIISQQVAVMIESKRVYLSSHIAIASSVHFFSLTPRQQQHQAKNIIHAVRILHARQNYAQAINFGLVLSSKHFFL